MEEAKEPKKEDVQKILDYLNGEMNIDELKQGLGPEYGGSDISKEDYTLASGLPVINSIRDFYDTCRKLSKVEKEAYAALYLKAIEANSKEAGLDTKNIMYMAQGAVHSIVYDNREPPFTVNEMMEFWKRGAQRAARKELLQNLSEIEKHVTLHPSL
ncbi:MAG: hypothetical protein ACE5J7_00080 [Candidatus Aenigmatarchaeota archaeon]